MGGSQESEWNKGVPGDGRGDGDEHDCGKDNERGGHEGEQRRPRGKGGGVQGDVTL